MAPKTERRLADLEHAVNLPLNPAIQVIWDESELEPDNPDVLIVRWPEDLENDDKDEQQAHRSDSKAWK